ncbi:MAG: hypothetical protein HUK20_01410 [Fibrobacter sp.]|nr:hypothetical protein [Fibrobacter sp.]
MSFFTTRKPVYLNLSLLFAFLGGWIFSYLFPVVKSFIVEDDLFYGTVTHAAIPSVFGGSDIPFFDKTMFQINGDDQVTFVLYASKEILDEMSSWYSFAAMNAGEIPLEISAARVADNRYIVHSMASTDGDLFFEDLVVDYQVYWAFIVACIICGLWLVALVLMVLWLVKRRR